LKKLHLPFVGLLGLYAGLVNAPTVAFASLWGIPYLMKAYHLSSMSASKIVSFVWIGQILGGSIVGWLCDRFNHRMLLLLGAFGAFLSMWFIIDPHFQNMPLLILCMMTLGIFCSSNYIAFAIVAKYMPQEVTGLASGIVSTLNIALGTLLQLIISLLVGNLIQDKMEVLVLTKSTLLLPLIGVPIFLLLGMFVAFLIRVNRSLKAS
jgi:MFS family permease